MTDSSAHSLISADSHVVEPPDLFTSRLPAGLRERAPRLGTWNGGSAWLLDGSTPVPLPATAATGSGYRLPSGSAKPITFDQVLPGLYDPAERLGMQDTGSIDAEVLYPSPALSEVIGQITDPELSLACVRAYNDWIAAFCSHSPDRLIGLAKVPSTTSEDARQEVLRCVKELSLRGLVLDAWPSGSTVAGAPGDEPFWEAVDGTGVPVSLHYALGTGAPGTPPAGIAPGLRPPMADAGLPLVAAGVLDRYPNIRLVFAHGDAGWAIHWLEFMDINYVRHRHLDEYALQNRDALPSDYLRKHAWFTFHQDRSAVRYRHKLGVVNLLWASHLPLEDAVWPDDRQQAARVTEELSAEERRALWSDNTARLYRLPGHEKGFTDADLQSFEPLVHF